MSFDVKTIAGEVVQVDEGIMKALPFISTIIGFVPGAQIAAPFMPMFSELLTVIDNAAKAVSEGNNSQAATSVLGEIMNHLTPGAPNSPILSAPLPNMPKADTP
jgi:hypothetical protein